MSLWQVTSFVDNPTMEESTIVEVVEATRAEMEEMQARADAMIALEGDLVSWDYVPLSIFSYKGWRESWDDILTPSPGDGEPLDTYPAGTDIGTYVADGNGPERDFIAGEPK